MIVPKPPFHSAAEELLYAIYQKISSDTMAFSANDINTLAKLNAIVVDADLISTNDLANAMQGLSGAVPAPGNSLQKLYDLIVNMQNAFAGLNALKASDIDTLAEINNLIVDADVVSSVDLSGAVTYLEALIANLPILSTVIYNFNSNLFTEQAIAFQGMINTISQNFTDEIVSIIYETSLDVSPKNWVGQVDLVALQNWVNANISGTLTSGTTYWIRCSAIYKAGHTGQAQNIFTYRQS